MTGLAIGSIKARDEISEVVVIAFRTWLLDTFVLVSITDLQISRLAGTSSSPQTSGLVSYLYFLRHHLILGILSKKLGLSHAQIYPISSSVVLPFLPPMVD